MLKQLLLKKSYLTTSRSIIFSQVLSFSKNNYSINALQLLRKTKCQKRSNSKEKT